MFRNLSRNELLTVLAQRRRWRLLHATPAPAPIETYVLDEFNFDNIDPALHVIAPTNPLALSWTKNSGNPEIIVDKLAGAGDWGAGFITVNAAAYAECLLTADLTPEPDWGYDDGGYGAGIVCHLVDASNFWCVLVDSADGSSGKRTLRIFEVVGGVWTERAKAEHTHAGRLELQVVLDGAAIQATAAWLGGSVQLSYEGVTLGLTSGKHGLYVASPNSWAHYFKLEA